MDYNKIEDAVLKKAMDIFKQSAVNFFGIDTKIIAPAQTEIKNIDIKTNYTDFLFYASDDSYLHFEFQTTNKRDDIKRFLYYDASLFYRDKRKVRTIVVYSSDIEEADEYIDAGTIKYNIEVFYMKNLDYEKNLQYLENKIDNKEPLGEEDILKLTFLPLMKSSENKSLRAIKSIELADKIEDRGNKSECISLLYALFEKFGDEISKKKFKEVFSMTEIGKMIRDEAIKEGLEKGLEKGLKKGLEEGLEKGLEKGKLEGKAETLIKQLAKKFGKMPEEYRIKIKKLPEEIIDIISLEIFDIKEIKEIEKYF